MKYVSGRIVRGIYTWLGWSGELAEPIGSSVPVRAHYFLLARAQVERGLWSSLNLCTRRPPIGVMIP